jgi:hypothetical protein
MAEGELERAASAPIAGRNGGGGAAGALDLGRASAALDAERWSVRAQIGGFLQRASVRLVAAATATGIGMYVGDDDWRNSLLAVGGVALVGAASAAIGGIRYWRLFSRKWRDQIEHLTLVAGTRLRRLHAFELAAELRLPVAQAEHLLQDLRRRSVVDTDVDEEGRLVYLFPARDG